ncbi:uncharacterized protein L969DRAFT_15528 [Mixia osmundae IAM 14324]|uniref:Zn(2)-C6 fungal-type domain-containing protein n=1 Tax=Mixia osmundae (strain CBS 9802 / IAM 14324 / JCM 22182 / KY 12970) TaxID=764103 RepID=G7DYE5_MIXOS|nr:uncharacterized protein L969DRAFT_15528 [Mixia osmundae IAM 14324]KEI41507.1 hypothetical protein L969DRAFT_15528 [Mixia osmundae IAM 14324]GAA95605.1 hypothetical protein E5Q_02261 [Mixia osmundae IAM 14324]
MQSYANGDGSQQRDYGSYAPSQQHLQAGPAPRTNGMQSSGGIPVPATSSSDSAYMQQGTSSQTNGNGNSKAQQNAMKRKGKDPDKPAAKRSRIACVECRKNKQRCDGLDRIPCRRCESYNLVCTFDEAAIDKVKGSMRASGEQLSPELPPLVTTASQAPSGNCSNPTELSSRLSRIEGILANLSDRLISHHEHSYEHAVPKGADYSEEESESRSPLTRASSATHDAARSRLKRYYPLLSETQEDYRATILGASPIETFRNALDKSNQAAGLVTPSNAAMRARSSSISYSYGMPSDVILRKIVSPAEAQSLFDFFFAQCHPWAPFLDPVSDRTYTDVRDRNSLLFHAILATSAFYSLSVNDPAQTAKYVGIVAMLNENLGPIVITPRPQDLNVDFISALLVIILWKPIRLDGLSEAELSIAQSRGKIEVSSQSMIMSLCIRTAKLIKLDTVLALLPSVGHENKASPSSSSSEQWSTTPQIIAACRAYFMLLIIDHHRASMTDRTPSFDVSEALRHTRLFAAGTRNSSDVRLAAFVELYAHSRTPPSNARGNFDALSYHARETEVAKWSQFWMPLHRRTFERPEEEERGLASLNAHRLWIRISNFVYYSIINLSSIMEQSETTMTHTCALLHADDKSALAAAVGAAEELIFMLSVEGRACRLEGASVDWTRVYPRADLVADPQAADLFKTSIDTLICLVISYPAIFLTKLRVKGLINCNLDTDPEYNTPSVVTRSKLHRLLLLTVDFLELASPNAQHIAKQSANALRNVAETALKLPGVTLPPGDSSKYPTENGRSSTTEQQATPQYTPAPLSSVLDESMVPPNELELEALLSTASASLGLYGTDFMWATEGSDLQY